ncbi:MAG: beta-ketoacyl-[acyl-carrier-protein] synthase family protein [bacterium]|nr:beta-ketoacyl-[acyl-carrier-protein] synthase family protein [bacterium]
MTEKRRVAVTGIGVISPVGIGLEAFWQGLLSPQPTGPRRAQDFDPKDYYEDAKAIRRADRFEQFAVAAAQQALEQSGALTVAKDRIGVLVGTGIGGAQTHEDQTLVLDKKGARRVSPFTVPMMMANAGSAAISMRHGFQGPCECLTTACATGTHAIGSAARWIQYGICDAVVAGGSEAAMTPIAISGFANMKALSATGISRPFDATRDGFVISEGGAVLVLEEWEEATRRGATILGEILGSASVADAHHITAPAPGGAGATRCMQRALDDANLEASAIAHINAHGTSTPLNDRAEAEGIAKMFGRPGPIVTSIKGVTGHSLGASGALEAASVLLAMHHALIPPTDGLEQFDPELPRIDVVQKDARPWTPGPSLSNSFGFGGHNGTVVLGPA